MGTAVLPEDDSSVDKIDKRILGLLQKDSEMSLENIAHLIGVSTATCWRRVEALRQGGVILGSSVQLSEDALNLKTTVVVLIRALQHTQRWLGNLAGKVAEIPEIVCCWRISGEHDYLLVVKVPDLDHYDKVYKRLLPILDGDQVTTIVRLESLKDQKTLPLEYL
jgi:Lrp/AsnC family transcriptional regulator